MKTFPLLLVSLTTLGLSASAQTVIRLWEGAAPGALGDADQDRPTLTVYPAAPERANGAAVVICPGGGYGGLAPHEGKDYALWLNEHGVAGFVLKYRLGSHGYRHPVMLQDAARAVRLVRTRAMTWAVDPQRIGIMGSSAGGHLASTLLTHWDSGKQDATDEIDRASSRPDLGILCYPVISMGANTHLGSRRNLLGAEPTPEMIQWLSNELQVTTNTPPCFLWHTWEDRAVKLEGVLDFAAALQRHGVPFDLHVYQRGPHGLGLGSRNYDPTQFHPWTRDCAFWLAERGFLRPTTGSAEKSGKAGNK